MARLLFWSLALPIAVVAVLISISNRHAFSLDLWPLPYQVTLPVYIAVLAPFLVGLLFGAVSVWLADGRWRRLARVKRREAARLEREVERLRTPPAELPSS